MQSDGFCLKRYYREISRKPLLTATEEKDLSRLAHKGDLEARRQLIEANLRFVVKMAIPYSNHGLPLEDLIQEGNIGLLEGIERFDPERGFRLTTYVSWWIRLAIQRAIEQKSAPIRIPANKLELMRKVKSFRLNFEVTKGRVPTHAEVARGLRIKKHVIEELQGYEASFISLDQANEEDTPSLFHVLEDQTNEHPEKDITQKEMKHQLNLAMRVLSPKERDVLRHRFGLSDERKGLSLRQIGRLIGLSAEGVRRIEEQALQKLRRPMVRSYVEGFV
ncbi:MAG: RNA polymerase sigma factor RpoD/SigA [Candidatus Omnitrophica bacterium]|nr:RNA polymerase sigma factor RpoD/SigA [bacterium]MCC6734321.1 RNA polymerase sigma factor RpoD/SigA [Candidatus Omnitrophota bacterium]MCE7908502.1 RNA polymerase sigma factor RpoD/SigA [Candidatus Omnitrophica bacterium COP1]MBV6480421.1 RNA polymerase sigma factor SigA [bacterium]MCK6494948.1 RNA polymerase sigma factor RpoD/SigA [bacterium]